MKKMVNPRIALSLLFVFAVVGCKAPPQINDDTLVTSTVDGMTFIHRHAVSPPVQLTPVNEEYRALYPASVMTRPDFGSKVVSTLKSGENYSVLGMAENHWLALGEQPRNEAQAVAGQINTPNPSPAEAKPAQLIGYVPFRAAVKSALYEQTLKADQPKRRVRAGAKKKNCLAVDGESKACQNSNSGTWIIN